MSLPATDSFNRADSAVTLGNNDQGVAWTTTGGAVFGISSNRAYIDSGAGMALLPLAGDLDMACDTVTQNLDGIVFRESDVNNHWRVVYVSAFAVFNLSKTVAGVNTNVANSGLAASNPRIRVVAAGSSIRVYLDGIERISATDSFNQTAVNAGLWADTTGVGRWDNFYARWGALPAPSPRIRRALLRSRT